MILYNIFKKRTVRIEFYEFPRVIIRSLFFFFFAARINVHIGIKTLLSIGIRTHSGTGVSHVAYAVPDLGRMTETIRSEYMRTRRTLRKRISKSYWRVPYERMEISMTIAHAPR